MNEELLHFSTTFNCALNTNNGFNKGRIDLVKKCLAHFTVPLIERLSFIWDCTYRVAIWPSVHFAVRFSAAIEGALKLTQGRNPNFQHFLLNHLFL